MLPDGCCGGIGLYDGFCIVGDGYAIGCVAGSMNIVEDLLYTSLWWQ